MWSMFFHYRYASGGSGRLGVPALFGRVAGYHSGPLLWPCVLSKLYPVAAAGVLLWRGVRLWGWYVRRASSFRGVIGMSLIERKDYDKTRMRGRKKEF